MALLVTIGNICILGNFQLGIWGYLGRVLSMINQVDMLGMQIELYHR